MLFSKQSTSFVCSTGYKDMFDVPEDDDNSLLRRTTPVHHAARGGTLVSMRKVERLFCVYDRFDVNYVDELGLTHFHAACLSGDCLHVVRKFLERGRVDPNLVWPETGDSPLHLVIRHGRHHAMAVELLLRHGADPNLPNDEGHTPLHVICQNDERYDSQRYLYHGETEKFFQVTDELNLQLQVDARDKLGRTPLQFAVANLLPHTVETLLDRGADLSSFVLLPEYEFTARFDPNKDNSNYFKLSIASGALAVLESLEKRGYEVKDFALIIMKIFSRLRLFKKSTYVHTRWYDDEEFASQAEQIQILPRILISDYFNGDILEFGRAMNETEMTPSLSLNDLIRLRPEEAEKILTHWDYYDLDRTSTLLGVDLGHDWKRTVMLQLCYDRVSRGFCRRWALEYFFELIHYRLPILCCEKIIDQLMNEDLCNICFAATGQDPY
ncbi:uncharacterized protein LOC106654670 [Trichogramma pretiosum]|uniref:uncharacterized protein LOC106654670 n=1 Tax=Trichogramma pretiosum TaxID=7493 RepID=UPI0006C97439|nr:uncharacterized protein LOC106654670 [Trichogramma pretiosum]